MRTVDIQNDLIIRQLLLRIFVVNIELRNSLLIFGYNLTGIFFVKLYHIIYMGKLFLGIVPVY